MPIVSQKLQILSSSARLWSYALICVLTCSMANSYAQGTLELSAGIHRIQAEVAHTYAKRAEGLMHRRTLLSNSGMLFVFDRSARHCMWMRNTLIPLSAAFLDEQGVIINIAEMLPQTENEHCASQPAKFVLEMNAAWFKNKGLAAGMSLKGIDKAPSAR